MERLERSNQSSGKGYYTKEDKKCCGDRLRVEIAEVKEIVREFDERHLSLLVIFTRFWVRALEDCNSRCGLANLSSFDMIKCM